MPKDLGSPCSLELHKAESNNIETDIALKQLRNRQICETVSEVQPMVARPGGIIFNDIT